VYLSLIWESSIGAWMTGAGGGPRSGSSTKSGVGTIWSSSSSSPSTAIRCLLASGSVSESKPFSFLSPLFPSKVMHKQYNNTCARHFNGHFQGEPRLASCPLPSPIPGQGVSHCPNLLRVAPGVLGRIISGGRATSPAKSLGTAISGVMPFLMHVCSRPM